MRREVFWLPICMRRGKFCLFVLLHVCCGTLVRVRYCLSSASCLLKFRGYRFSGYEDAAKAFQLPFRAVLQTTGCSFHYRHFWYLSADTSCSLLICFPVYLQNCSVFGEDALVNVSVEKKEDNDGKLAGYIRIRSKTQGIALSLGDRITSVQRGTPDKK